MSNTYLRLEHYDADILLVWIDDPEDSVNTLKQPLAAEFNQLLTQLEQQASAKAVIFISAKPDNFIAGANLELLQSVNSAAEASSLSKLLQQIHNRLEALPLLSIAAIHGACLGGGLEFALALKLRIASDDSVTRIGLPEVQLGLLPGGGGTQRLLRQLPLQNALELLLTGKQLNSKRALQLGLIDARVPAASLLELAIQHAKAWLELPQQRITPKWRQILHPSAWREALLRYTPPGRKLVLDKARKQSLQTTHGHYPAPLKIIEVVKTGLQSGFQTGLEAEATAFGELAVTPVAKQLIHLFFSGTALKKSARNAPLAEPINKIGVLGGGLMGAGISYVSLHQAHVPVRLKDREAADISKALHSIHGLIAAQVQRQRLRPLDGEQILSRLSVTTDYQGFGDADIIIEAVYEDLAVKQQVLRDMEACTSTRCIFASNTSALPISAIATASQHPETVIGMHYFSPVDKMPLLEIIVTPHTADWVLDTCLALGHRQGKTVIVVKDSPGFYTTRILGMFLLEAALLVSEGVSIERIDQALVAFGFPRGPLALLDEVGIDVGAKVAATLQAAFGERVCLPAGLQKLLDDQRYGRKNGRGFYRYPKAGSTSKTTTQQVDKRVYQLMGVTPNNPLSDAEISQRCVLALVNEAHRCHDEGLLRNTTEGDIGAVYGLGFPPYLGGPFRYASAEGKALHGELQRLQARYGSRFAPAKSLS